MKNKKIAVITGASRGIGKSISIALSEIGYTVMLFGRSKKKLVRLKKKIEKNGSKAEVFIGDVTNSKFVNLSISTISKKYNNIDLLINNAGVAYFNKLVDSTLEQFQDQINTNLIGVFNFTKAVISGMIKNQTGTIINIISQAGKFGFKYGTTYAATKHAVVGFSKSLMLEVREHNVKVVMVSPGSVDTEMIVDSPIHKNIKQVLKPQDISDLIVAIVKLPPRALVADIDIKPNNP